jgi:hypothetical protein
MKQAPAKRRRLSALGAAIALLCMIVGVSASLAAPPLSGAIFTTDSTCTGTNVNIFSAKSQVYLDGGPAHPGAAGLPDGYYYVKVTEPDGTLLGTSVGTANETPAHVTSGDFDLCYQLSSILHKASDAPATPFPINGYDTTSNPGGEYKVWVSSVSSFDSNSSKTDNFKVKGTPECETECGPPPSGTLTIEKCYDANASGACDPGEQKLTGWRMRIQDNLDWIRHTDATGTGPLSLVLDPDKYCVTESDPVQQNWFHTGVSGGAPINPIAPGESQCDSATPNANAKTAAQVNLAVDGAEDIVFANVCVGAGGGLTLGFWSNKNGQKLEDASDFAALTAMNLKKANGTDQDFTGNLSQNKSTLNSFLLGANATNMANMLSAQLAAMTLNVRHGNVNGEGLVYAPGALGANANGFISVNKLIAEANTELGLHPLSLSGSPYRAYQEALKTALDKANNNLTFVQSTPCAFSFPAI